MKDVLTNLSKLPVFCYAVLDGQVVQIRRGAREPSPAPTMTKDGVARMNLERGVTEAQVKAMIVGVTLGWDMDGADPDHQEPEEPIGDGPFSYTYQTELPFQITVTAMSEELAAKMAMERLLTVNESLLSFAEDIEWGSPYQDTLDLVESTDPREV